MGCHPPGDVCEPSCEGKVEADVERSDVGASQGIHERLTIYEEEVKELEKTCSAEEIMVPAKALDSVKLKMAGASHVDVCRALPTQPLHVE